jgi:hypothetical protein
MINYKAQNYDAQVKDERQANKHTADRKKEIYII